MRDRVLLAWGAANHDPNEFEEMIGQLPDLRLSTPDIEISGGNLRGPKSLPVEWSTE